MFSLLNALERDGLKCFKAENGKEALKYSAALFDRSLRNNVVFAAHNLASDESFNEFQLILCRNVLIYFNQDLQNKVMNLFYNSLCTFGILGLGNKESLLLTNKQKCLEPIDKKEKVFIKTA
ncbi:MAG: CheR family methyltransferase [Cyclobacteriaceae bacterium]